MHFAISFACMGNEKTFPVLAKLNLGESNVATGHGEESRQTKLVERLSARGSISQLVYYNTSELSAIFCFAANRPSGKVRTC
jgi:hypothetical protein